MPSYVHARRVRGLPPTLRAWQSEEIVATGTKQEIAHPLRALPSAVILTPTGGHDGKRGPGHRQPRTRVIAQDTDKVVVAVTAGARFQVTILA